MGHNPIDWCHKKRTFGHGDKHSWGKMMEKAIGEDGHLQVKEHLRLPEAERLEQIFPECYQREHGSANALVLDF